MHPMTINEFPAQVFEVLNALISEKETESIWFVGSRANGTERPDSDWDFIVFVCDKLSERRARHSQIDIIRVDQNGSYLLEGQPIELSGQFKTWQWREIEPGRATYTVRATPEIGAGDLFDIQDMRLVELRGLNVWRRNV